MSRITDKQLKRFSAFYYDPKNWRPPTLSQVVKFLGVKSKKTAWYWVKKLKAIKNNVKKNT
jgi:hypothetical protein